MKKMLSVCGRLKRLVSTTYSRLQAYINKSHAIHPGFVNAPLVKQLHYYNIMGIYSMDTEDTKNLNFLSIPVLCINTSGVQFEIFSC